MSPFVDRASTRATAGTKPFPITARDARARACSGRQIRPLFWTERACQVGRDAALDSRFQPDV
jgi:hypothetical protein